jgi:thiol-disulfide isomerase/thioredoxin
MLQLSCLLLCFLLARAVLQEAPDGSVCFNNCNGHGDCIDYSCHCWTGFIGDDCGTTFADVTDIVPILSAGHFNITRKNFTQVVSKHKLMLVGFSSYNCHKCITIEPAYRNISEQMRELSLPFGRADADKMKSIAAEVGATELPALVLFHKMRPILYKGVHSADAVMTYIRKQLDPPARKLKTVSDVTNFVAQSGSDSYGISTTFTVGFFSEHEDVEEDDYTEFMKVAKELQLNEDTYFGVVTSPTTANWFKKNKTIDRTPSVLMVAEGGARHTINLDELYGDNAGIQSWILKNAIPLVGKMTPQNFLMYEKQGLPILMMFLDLTDELTPQPGVVGGKSGGIYNEDLLEEFRLAAKEHQHRILFVYLDGTKHGDQMKSLGLYGGKERLPSIAFNTRDGAQVPFPEELPVNKDTILQFCADFISGMCRTGSYPLPSFSST